jgi:Protein of unknown function (DUF1573)
MRQPILSTGIGLGVLGLVVASVPSGVRSNPSAANHDSLRVTAVDLGRLCPGETRKFTVSIRNAGARPVTLRPPQTDCGCLYRVRNTSLTIPAEGSIELPFSFRAPPWPGYIHKKITLTAGDGAAPGWEAPITANVVASAWAVPPALQLRAERSSVLEASLVIYHDDQTQLGRVVSDSPGLQAELEHRTPTRTQLTALIHPRTLKAGETWERALQVLDADDSSVLLTIPVRVVCPPELQCIPNELALDDRQVARTGFERTVLVLAHSDAATALDAHALVPWVRVQSVERLARKFRVRLRFDSGAIPAHFRGNIVRFAVQGKQADPLLLGVHRD